MPLTTQGKAVALEGLRLRRERGQIEKKINNSALYAGDPMYYDCAVCGCQDIVMPEGWFISKPDLCTECEALKACGWAE